MPRVKYREIIADNLSEAGWSLGWVSVVDCEGRTIWIVDAHRDGKRFIVDADEKLTAFMELEAATRGDLPDSCPPAVLRDLHRSVRLKSYRRKTRSLPSSKRI